MRALCNLLHSAVGECWCHDIAAHFQGCHRVLGNSTDFQAQSRFSLVAFICQADTNSRFVVGMARINEFQTELLVILLQRYVVELIMITPVFSFIEESVENNIWT